MITPFDVPKEYLTYQLCFVDEVSEEVYDYTEESKLIMKTKEYKEYSDKKSIYFEEFLKERGSYSCYDLHEYDEQYDPEHKFKLEMEWKQNPLRKSGYTHILYFTKDLSEQWGDDWNDAPYEHNAGLPYGDDIIEIPICIEDCIMPSTYWTNSPYSVSDINKGACAWIFINFNRNSCDKKTAIAFYGGDTLHHILHEYKKFIKEYNKSE